MTKYTPTPLERTRRTTSSMRSMSTLGASLNSRWASSKKKTSLGFQGRQFREGSNSRTASTAKGGVQAWRIHELVGRQDVDDAPAVHRLHEVLDVEHGLTKELVAALLLDLQQAALDGPTLAELMLPYSVVKSLALSPTYCSMAAGLSGPAAAGRCRRQS